MKEIIEELKKINIDSFDLLGMSECGSLYSKILTNYTHFTLENKELTQDLIEKARRFLYLFEFYKEYQDALNVIKDGKLHIDNNGFESQLMSFKENSNMLHIGSGPLPVSSIGILKSSKTKFNLHLLDIDLYANATAISLCKKINIDLSSVILADALEHSYEIYSHILISNMISPKNAVLKRISETAKAKTVIMLRTPVEPDTILGDSVNVDDFEQLRIINESISKNKSIKTTICILKK